MDLDGAIDHYEWCVGESAAPGEDAVLPCRDVGIGVSASARVPVPLLDGEWRRSRGGRVAGSGGRDERGEMEKTSIAF